MKLRFKTCLATFALAMMLSPVSAEEFKTLTVGDVAPPLNVEHWVQDNDGKLQPVTEFEKGKVYIVEFWATWCGPCIMSMPHLAETQVKYGYDDVRLISISDEDLETVTEFLGQTVRGEEEKTYKELTSVYSLTTDPDQSSNADYMQAAGQNGIPTAFIVGKAGLVEWVGHPMNMDEPLEEIVKDTWNRDAFAVGFKKEQASALAMMKLQRLLMSEERADQEQAYAMVVDQLAKAEDSDAGEKQNLEMMQIMLLVKLEQGAKAAEIVSAKLDSAGPGIDDVMSAAQVVMMIPQTMEGFDKKALVKLAVEKITAAADIPEVKESKMAQMQIKANVAQLYQSANLFDEAIKSLTEAKELAGEEPQIVNALEQMLGQIKQAKEAAESESAKPAGN